MKANRPRKSHYLSKFYLAGFTVSGGVEDDLYVFDQITGRDWRSSPASAAIEKDFYVVDVAGEDPDIMEKILARLEGDFSRIVRDIVKNQQLPDGDDFNWFLNFVALMITRVPRTRKVVAGSIDRASKTDFRKLFATRAGWAQFRETCERAGHPVPDEEYEKYKRFADSEDYTVDLDQTTHVQMMATHMIDSVLPPLAKRTWSLAVAAPNAPDLICSDCPVALWPSKCADMDKPITLLSPDTVLSFPITRRLVAIGRYERQKRILGIKPQGIALCNTWTLSGARQVFYPEPDFTYLKLEGNFGHKADLLKLYRRTPVSNA
jgi:hypothetical protein